MKKPLMIKIKKLDDDNVKISFHENCSDVEYVSPIDGKKKQSKLRHRWTEYHWYEKNGEIKLIKKL
jgi:hypothetical protein